MLNRFTLALAGTILLCPVFAQQRTLIGFQLRAYLERTAPDTPVDLFLQGSAPEVERIARAHGAQVKMSMRNWTSVRMPAGRIHELNAEPAVLSIEFTSSRPHTMNDSMRVKTHIDWIHQGLAPLPRPYTGKGVVMGIVDTGLDFDHPDFIDSITGSRVLHYWDHNFPFSVQNTPQPYGYGQEWDKATIDAGNCPATDQDNGGHGTTVAGTAAGNGGETGQHTGAAPESDLIIVATDFDQAINWPNTVADGVRYVFDHATDLGKPAVVNLSLGDYLGSHDGLDPAALFIDSMLMAAPGRSVVCAAGNSYCFPNYQLRMDVDADTSFAWIKTNTVNPLVGLPWAYIDFWADTAAMNDVWYSVGADKVTGGYSFRGRIPFRNVQGTIATYVDDTLYNENNDTIAFVSTYGTLRGGQYHLEIAIINPDSADYNWRIMMTGSGRADAWDNNGFGLSEIVSTGLPTVAEFPAIANYVLPTLDRGIVDSWACSPHVITVANYNNELSYPACDGSTQTLAGTEGTIATCTSVGLTRTDQQKPDLAAPGDITFSAAPLPLIDAFVNGTGAFKLSADCMHVRSGGTSIASPAVAGAAALFLEKCPFATHQQVKDALVGSAFTDAFTGAVPNARWGYGKLDAYTPLVATNFDVVATGGDPFCPGDSSLAQAPPGFESYLWSDGTVGEQAWSQGEPLVLTVINADGCKAGSDTIFFDPFVVATPTITQDGHELTSTSASSYAWFLNGSPIPGADGQVFNAVLDGSYTVVTTDANGCTSVSDPLVVSFIGMAEINTVPFSLWPVPARDELFVTVDAAGASDYRVIDAEGREVKHGSLRGAGTSVLDIGNLAPGAYTLRLVSGADRGMRMFIVR